MGWCVKMRNRVRVNGESRDKTKREEEERIILKTC